MMATTRKGDYAASRQRLRADLIKERLTNVRMPGYQSAAMEWGANTEPEALNEYLFRISAESHTPIGFVLHPTLDEAGCSPDGLINHDGLVEIKCPESHTHVETLLNEKVPGEYMKQIQFQLLCTERSWCDYVSYDPRMPPEMSLFIRRVPRDPQMIDLIQNELHKFLREVAETVTVLKQKYGIS